MLTFPCPVCGAAIKAPDSMAGRAAKCPNCKRPVRAPSADEPPPAFDVGPTVTLAGSPAVRGSPPVTSSADSAVGRSSARRSTFAPRSASLPTDALAAGQYEELKGLAKQCRLLAGMCCVVAVVGILIGVYTASENIVPGLVVAGGTVFWGVLAMVSLLVAAEGIRLMIDVAVTLTSIRDHLTINIEPTLLAIEERLAEQGGGALNE